MRHLFMSILLLAFHTMLFSQHSNSELPLSINEDGAAPHESAIVDIQSSDKGLLIPRMPFCDIEQIANPEEGLMVYDTEFHCLRIYILGKWHCLYQKMTGPGAAASVTGWANPTYDEDYNSGIVLDSEENVYVTMETEDSEIRLTKFDKKGNTLWTVFEGSGSTHNSPAVDSNDNVFTVASGPAFNGVAISPSGFFISKTSPDGATSEVYTLPGASIIDLAIDPAGNVFFTFSIYEGQSITFNGTTYTGTAYTNGKVGVAKLDNNFNEMWVQVFDIYSGAIDALTVDDAGDVYLTGLHQNGIGLFPINASEIKTYNVFLSKLSGTNGTHFWTKNYGTDLNSIYYVDVKWADDLVFLGWLSNGGAQVNGYDSTNGAYRFRLQPTGTESSLSFNVNAARNEVAITFRPVIVDTPSYETPARLLIYNYDEPWNNPISYDQTFYRPGKLTFSEDGSKIYGIAEGTIIGNIEIDNNDEDHIIYKFSNQ